MPHTVISTCPVCSGELSVTRLQCRSCGTAIEGEFNVGRFGRLGREQFALLESFLRARGNLKELERELKVSYPTVRARVDALVRSLGLADDGGVDDTYAGGGDGEGDLSFEEEFGTGGDRSGASTGSGDASAVTTGRVAGPTAGLTGPTEPSAGGTVGEDAGATSAATADARRDILERLARHEIGAEEAATLIRALGRE